MLTKQDDSLCVRMYAVVVADRCTRSQRWSMVAMATMRAEGHLSRLSMHETGPLRSHSAFKMTVRMRCLWRQTTKGLVPKHSVDSGKRGNPVAF